MKASQSSKKSLTKVVVLSILIPALIVLVGWIYVSITSKSQLKLDEGWYQTFTLKNGLQVIVLPNHKIPAVSQMIWYRAGAMEDPHGKSGIAHFLEHLMFKGTAKYPAGEFSKLVEQNGGQENAFTTHDYTAFFQKISKDKLKLILKLEADRMRNLALKPEDVEPEQKVIIEERRMRIDNQPRALLREQMDASLYQNHPYGTQVIGWMKDMEGLTREDAIEFYNKYYAPNNAILIISGDVEMRNIEPLVRRYYGRIPANKEIHTPIPPDLPQQVAAREVEYADERVKEPELWRSYLAPSYNADDEMHYFSLVLLSKILGEGNLSRLYKSLVIEKKIATVVGGDYSGLTRGPGEFYIYAIPAKGIPVASLRAEIDFEVNKIIREGVSDEELESAKRSIIATQVYNQEGLQGMATIVGSLMMVGIEPEFVTTFPDSINAVTAEQVQEAAEDLFKKENSVTGILKGK